MENSMTTDIYNITETIDNIKKKYLEDETEDTLAVSTYGYLGAVQSILAQNVIMNVSELANEVFPSRAKLDKNILMHCVSYNITDINSTPAKINCMIGILESDLLQLFNNGALIIDHNCKFYIEDFEYHLDYDIIITNVMNSAGESLYTARYDMSITNNISDIINPYLQSPIKIQYLENNYIFISCHMRQVAYNNIETKVISSNKIENKIYTFEFEDQLADFMVEVYDGDKIIKLTPILEGINLNNITNYCYYSYIDSNTIRVQFDSGSYIPGINCTINTLIQTTKGSEGNFSYNKDIMTVLESDKYNYRNSTVLLKFQSDSMNGKDAKEPSDLRKLLPKEILAKGVYTTTTDLMNYFNRMNDSNNKIEVKDKLDNQLSREFYAYIIMKDNNNTIIPTNTIKILVSEDDFDSAENGVFTINQGTPIIYDPVTKIGKIVRDNDPLLETSDFVYTIPFLTVVNFSPLYTSYYEPLINKEYIINFLNINSYSPVTFIAGNLLWKRDFINDPNLYKMGLSVSQNINSDFGLLEEIKDETGNITDVVENIKLVAVLYKDDTAYRYAEADLVGYDLNTFTYNFEIDLSTQNIINEDNFIKIENIYNIGTTESAYGYFPANVNVEIFVLAKFDTDYGKFSFNNYVPGYDGWTVTNIYNTNEEISFFTNYSENISSFIKPTTIINEDTSVSNGYSITGVPVVKRSYFNDGEHIDIIMNQLIEKKTYIDNAIMQLENNFGIDFKFFNTFGPSNTYTLPDNRYLDTVNIIFKFRTKLFPNVDPNILTNIKVDIKSIVENINEINSIHIPNIISYVEKKYGEGIEYFEFLGFNNYGPGIQHLYRNELPDLTTVPECVNIAVDEETLEPSIYIEVSES